MELEKKKCKPCEGGTPALDAAAVKGYLRDVSGWQAQEVSPGGEAGKKIGKEFRFKTFLDSIVFVNKVAKVAEEEGHHPSIFISYNKVKITLTTHAIGGLSENDFIMAAKIDRLTSQ